MRESIVGTMLLGTARQLATEIVRLLDRIYCEEESAFEAEFDFKRFYAEFKRIVGDYANIISHYVLYGTDIVLEQDQLFLHELLFDRKRKRISF